MSDDDRGSKAGRAWGPAGIMPFADIDPGQMGGAYGQTMLELQRDWLVGMGKLQRDYLSFLGERMRKDVEIAKRMAECRDFKAAMELQTAFVETAREDYVEEAQKLFAMSRELAESCTERLAEIKPAGKGKA